MNGALLHGSKFLGGVRLAPAMCIMESVDGWLLQTAACRLGMVGCVEPYPSLQAHLCWQRTFFTSAVTVGFGGVLSSLFSVWFCS
jgi:hypothetical protein